MAFTVSRALESLDYSDMRRHSTMTTMAFHSYDRKDHFVTILERHRCESCTAAAHRISSES
jgi:hypothetical protein